MELKLTPTFGDLNAIEQQHEPIPISTAGPQPYTLSSVTEPAPARKIAIIGTAPSSRDLAPYGDPSWEIWACSPGNMKILPRVNRWYELHVNLLWPEYISYGGPYIQWLAEQANAGAFEVWMQDQRYFPQAKTFPMKALVKEFGPYFFTSTFAWLMAAAIAEGVQEVALYGVDMASRDEYILQRPGGHYFIQKCRERGVKVTIPLESDLEQPPALYAYSENTPFLRKTLARRAELKGRIAHLEQQFNAAKEQMTYLKGADEDLDYQISIFGGAQHGMELREWAPGGNTLEWPSSSTAPLIPRTVSNISESPSET